MRGKLKHARLVQRCVVGSVATYCTALTRLCSNINVQAVRNGAKWLIHSDWFERATSIVILGNTVTMAMVHKDMDSELKIALGQFEMAFLVRT
jgi:hypothetical protein